ncbi:hypothetical protein Pelo_16682 [Pelomyxa schiedti]|nr:hypothetical protein Pelo_16682 [Pelomyxa schiedti]
MGAGAGTAEHDNGDDDWGGGGGRGTEEVMHTSRYFGLRCAGLAGSKRCAEWIVGHAVITRNNAKECLTVLKGLCAGGHLNVAQELLDPRASSYFKSLRWPRDNLDVADSISEMSETCHSVLFEACWGGSLETVKWVMSRFSRVGTEDWELVQPFLCAVKRGHVDIVKWLSSTTCALAACRDALLTQEDLFGSASVEVVKMCMEWFIGADRIPTLGCGILRKYMELAQQRNDIEFEEGCQWIKGTFGVPIDARLLSVRQEFQRF